MFKPGDKVRCIRGTGDFLFTGKIYTIEKVKNDIDEFVNLVELPDFDYYTSRFVRVDSLRDKYPNAVQFRRRKCA